MRDKAYRETKLGPSVTDWLAWLKTGNAAERTLDQYERDLSRACLMFPETGLADFGDTQMAYVAASFQPKERRVRVAAYRSFFKWAIRFEFIDRNPCDRLPEIKSGQQALIDTFDDGEIAALCGLPIRDGALMQLLFDAGLRKGEARNFRLGHVRGSDLWVVRGKGDKSRVIPATADVVRQVNELAILDGVNEQDYLWYCRPGGGSKISRARPIVESSFARWWTTCLDEAGVAYRNPHVTRHTFATRWLRRRGTLSHLSRVMGHASIKTTDDLYGHLDTSDLHDEVARLFPGEQTRTDSVLNQSLLPSTKPLQNDI